MHDMTCKYEYWYGTVLVRRRILTDDSGSDEEDTYILHRSPGMGG
jgi:hypothetical protein